MITDQVSFMGDHFNFSFSPRSSLLLHTFNISISQVQGTFRMEERYFDAPVTIGFRPLWQDWESNGRTLWNRYYLDYFVHFQRPIQLNFRSLSRTLLNHTFVSCVHHGLNTLHLVQYFNSFRSSPELSMLMHIPMTRDQRRAVENWNFPGDTPCGTLSLRLHVADFETLIFGCCNFELSATCQDLTFVQFTLNSLTCKDCTLDLKHL